MFHSRKVRLVRNLFCFVALWVAMVSTALAITKTEFKQKIRPGMTKAQVKDTLGKPDSTTELSDGSLAWNFQKVYDEDSEKETIGTVWFKANGTVERLSF